MNVGDAIEAAAGTLAASGSETARLDAQLLMGHVLGVDRTTVLAHPEAPVGDGQIEAFRNAVARRVEGEPVAYIRGVKEFYGAAISVDSRALIPRPETELLVDLALDRIVRVLTGAPRPAGTPPLLVLDLGTGSGAIAITLARLARTRRFAADVRFIASDTSADALALAAENAVGHAVADVIRFRHADLLAEAALPDGPFDLIVANLPYVPSADVPRLAVAARFEPPEALDGGEDGLDLVRRAVAQLPDALTEAGAAFFEVGSDQTDALARYAMEVLPGWATRVDPDLAGRPRVVAIARAGALDLPGTPQRGGRR